MKAILFTIAFLFTLATTAQKATHQDSTLNAQQIELRARYCNLDDVSIDHMDYAQSHFKSAGLFMITGGLGLIMMSPKMDMADRSGGKYFAACSFAVAGTHLVLGASRMRKALKIEDK